MKKNLAQLVTFAAIVLLWQLICFFKVFPGSLFPSPYQVVLALQHELLSGRLFIDTVASLFRVLSGFIISSALGIFLGITIAKHPFLTKLSLPLINFLRNLSAIAWIPFAIICFGIGSSPVIFLIVMGALFPTILATMSAYKTIPNVYHHIAHEYKIEGRKKIFKIILPSIAPQVLTTLRMTLGLSWVIMVAAEMIAGQEGLGFAIFDARNGMRIDLLIAEMAVIGFIGVTSDVFMQKIQKEQSVRWAYES